MDTERLVEVLEVAQRSGLTVDDMSMQHASEQVAPVGLALVLDAAAAFTRGEIDPAFRRLDLCWGARLDPCVSLVFDAGLVINREDLLNSVAAAVDQRSRQRGCVRIGIGRSIAIHKLIKNGVYVPDAQSSNASGAALKFEERNRAIGRVMATNDVDFVDHMRAAVQADAGTRVNEVWSLASYSGDLPTARRESPIDRNTSFGRTAHDVITDLSTVSGGYAYYLARVAVPTLMSFDPGFGGQRPALRSAAVAAAARAEDQGDRRLMAAANALAHA